MKNLILIIALLFSVVSLSQEENKEQSNSITFSIWSPGYFTYFEQNNFFSKTGEAYLFGDNVNFRKSPNLEAPIIDVLGINQKLEIIEDLALQNNINYTNHTNYNMNKQWYKVKVDDKIGYVHGSSLSIGHIKNNGSTFLFKIKGEDTDDVQIKLRILRDSNDFLEEIFKIDTKYMDKNDQEVVTFKFTDNKGLDNVYNIIKYNPYEKLETCRGWPDQVFIYTNNTLIELEEDEISYEGHNRYFIFPNDKGGEKYRVILKTEEYNSYNLEDQKTTTYRKWSWSGERFTEIK